MVDLKVLQRVYTADIKKVLMTAEMLGLYLVAESMVSWKVG